jgi:hypothetical protein
MSLSYTSAASLFVGLIKEIFPARENINKNLANPSIVHRENGSRQFCYRARAIPDVGARCRHRRANMTRNILDHSIRKRRVRRTNLTNGPLI